MCDLLRSDNFIMLMASLWSMLSCWEIIGVDSIAVHFFLLCFSFGMWVTYYAITELGNACWIIKRSGVMENMILSELLNTQKKKKKNA